VRESLLFRVLTGPPSTASTERNLKVMDNRNEIRDFLTSRRARITPEQAGLPAYGGHRRVAGLRREEVAMLAGVSVDYYTRLERGNAHGASENVLEALARALHLDAEPRLTAHGFRCSTAVIACWRRWTACSSSHTAAL
jgi:transcriptional regulator with XRE-family HTH domain